MSLQSAVPTPYFPIENTDDDREWAERNARWLGTSSNQPRRSRIHQRATQPLVLCGHGVPLRIEKGTLFIQNGFTHHPQEREIFRFFKGDLNLPPKLIMLDGSGSLSFDVLSWLSEQNVPLIRIGYQGDVVTVIGGAGSAYNPDLVAWQIATRADLEKRLVFCCDLIARKVRASVNTLTTAIPPSRSRDLALGRAEEAIARLNARAVSSANDVLMVEARAAAAYFTAWRGLPIRWRSKTQNPIPEGWETAGGRRTLRDSLAASNRNATHPVNAMLNYAYAVIQSQVQTRAVADGYDPRLGILHESRPDALALILDLVEPRRPVADAAVLNLIAKHALSGADFVIRSDGVCRLAPQLARRLCAIVSAADHPTALFDDCTICS